MKILVVGAGFSGSVIARCFADAGHTVKIIDRREHIAGNAYDYINQHNIRIHKYGPHIFHTSNKKVIEFINRFCDWVSYEHKVKALLENGMYVTFPVNNETQSIVGSDNLINVFFRPYTKKMWGLDVENIGKDILERVPMRQSAEDRYFPDDSFQGFPRNGYTDLINAILQHPKIDIQLSTAFRHGIEEHFDHTFNSMPIDEYFLYDLGRLPYRSIRFHDFTIPLPSTLPASVINFTNSGPYTRVTEWKKFPGHGKNDCYTTLTFEEPCSYEENNFERYYPIKDAAGINRALYEKYNKRIPSQMTFIGRCGLYAYLDMHQAINSALQISTRFLSIDINV